MYEPSSHIIVNCIWVCIVSVVMCCMKIECVDVSVNCVILPRFSLKGEWNEEAQHQQSVEKNFFLCRSDKRTLFGGVGSFLGKMLCVWHEKWKMRSILCGNKFFLSQQPRTLVWFLLSTFFTTIIVISKWWETCETMRMGKLNKKVFMLIELCFSRMCYRKTVKILFEF